MRSVIGAVMLSAVLVGCGGEAETPVPEGDPGQPVGHGLRGHEYHGHSMLTEGRRFLWAQNVLAGYRGVNDEDLPTHISVLKQSCYFPKPAENDRVHHVHIGRGVQRAPVYAISAGEMMARAEKYAEAYIAAKGEPNGKFDGDDTLNTVNVAVTETDRPVYLVLTSQDGIIWNIQAAPDAKISQIAVIGTGTVGVANGPEGVPVAALGGKKLRACRVTPTREPEEHWDIVKNANMDRSEENMVGRIRARSRDYQRWLRNTFGHSGRKNLVGAYSVSNVLVGKAPISPDKRIAFTPLAKSTISITSEDYVFAANRQDYEKRNLALVKATAEYAAGGDLKTPLASAASGVP